MDQTRIVLESLLEAINKIDGGCSTCVDRFVEAANSSLEKVSKHHFAYSKETGRVVVVKDQE